MDELDRIDAKKKKILDCLEKHRGIVATACKCAEVSRASFYVYLNSDEEFKKEVDSINEGAIDFVESKLLENIDSNDTTAIIFFLKTKGKKRGYSEKDHESGFGGKQESEPFRVIDPETNMEIKISIGGGNKKTT